jgi:hypothetical protein
VRWGKTLDCLSRYAFCSLLVSLVCLSLSLYTSRERENVCCSWYSSRFNLGFRVSLTLSVSVLFLFVNVCSKKDRKRERINWGQTPWGRRTRAGKATKIALVSRTFFAEFICCVEVAFVVVCETDFRCVYHIYSLLFSLILFYIKHLDKGNNAE